MTADIRDKEVTPETEKLLLAGRAKAKKVWDHIKKDIATLDEASAFVCLHDLVIIHIGYCEGRWPGFAGDLIPVIMENLKEDEL